MEFVTVTPKEMKGLNRTISLLPTQTLTLNQHTPGCWPQLYITVSPLQVGLSASNPADSTAAGSEGETSVPGDMIEMFPNSSLGPISSRK